MNGRTLTLTNTVRINIVDWEESFLSFVSFSSEEDAAFFWAIRENIVPRFSEEICTISQHPFTKKWALLNHLIESEGDDKKEVFWKNAWYEGRLLFGKEVWKSYYKGVLDEQKKSVYDKGYGKTYFPEIK